MKRPTRLQLLEYAAEGLRTLIGTGVGFEYEEVLEEYEQHLEWINDQVRQRTLDGQALLGPPTP